jgi:soluble lytic murein transglycosylase
VILALVLCAPALCSAANKNSADRNTFTAAEKALKQNQMSLYGALKKQLEQDNYVLLPYLDYAELQKAFSKGEFPVEEVHAFLAKEQDTALGDRLRSSWLYYLAKKNQWELFVADYQSTQDDGLQCHSIYGHYKISNQASVLNEALPLWLYGKSRPESCDPVFNAWRAKGGLTEKLVWDRIYLAIEANQYAVVNYLIRYLPKQKQTWVQTWQNTYKDPNIISSQKLFKEQASFLRDTQIYGLKRIARRDPEKAAKIWAKLEKQYVFTARQKAKAIREIAIGMAMDHDPEALTWFNKISLAQHNDLSFEWHVRAALREGSWAEVARVVPQFPARLRKDTAWSYWLARSYEQTGKKSEAQAMYQALSQERTFAGVLSSERLGATYPINLPRIAVTESLYQETLNHKGIARALEFHAMDRLSQARREWSETIKRLSEEQIQAAAVIAYEQGWQQHAILTLAKAENQNNIDIRFPVLYRKHIEKEAKRNSLNPAWVFAIARRESAFVADIKSPVGATGLMQLMPYTAKQVAKQIKEPYHSPSQLTQVALNVRLGSAYLKSIYKDFDENMLLATAAYNAGPHRVKQWMPKNGAIPADVWIETVPFTETREYVKAVLIYQLIYQHHLNIKERLGSVLDDIEAS